MRSVVSATENNIQSHAKNGKGYSIGKTLRGMPRDTGMVNLNESNGGDEPGGTEAEPPVGSHMSIIARFRYSMP